MGNTATKFRKALINGDETLASQLYESNPQFKESLDPNTSYGEPYQHNTSLHYAARHAMSQLLSIYNNTAIPAVRLTLRGITKNPPASPSRLPIIAPKASLPDTGSLPTSPHSSPEQVFLLYSTPHTPSGLAQPLQQPEPASAIT
ncbi:UNVERIFIED_CONTAM: hypothetical protein FKN15_038993 [Acipenser sinensis]